MSGFNHKYQSLDYETVTQNNEDEVVFTSPQGYSKSKRPMSTMLAMTISIVVITILTYVSQISPRKSALRAEISELVSKPPEKLSAPSIVPEASISYTLVRKGYNILQYFEKDKANYVSDSFLSKYVAVIEPNVEMSLELFDDLSNDFSYSVCDSSSNCYSGYLSSINPDLNSNIKLPCSPQTIFTITVTALDENKNALYQSTNSAVCMYVRREITELNDRDLAATMDAMHALWKYSDSEGKTKYGENYKSALYFSSAHDFNAAQQDADHIHEGLGFLLQHIKLTNMFEQAMQVVDPSVSLPYWDFTRDVAAGLSIYDSPIFTDKMFGSITPPKDSFWGFTYRNDKLEDTAIQNGRWSHIKADKHVFENLSNGFGYMRGPWNTNPSPYVSRFSASSPSLPSCSNYFGGLGLPSYKDTFKSAPYGPHASTHGVIGAVFGCDMLDSFRESGIINSEDSQLNICKKWGFYMKEMYRANHLAPRTDCSASSLAYDDIDCGFKCNDETNFVSTLKTTISSTYLKSGISHAEYEQIKDFICEGEGSRIFVGDHLESASPSDPSFWVIHPTQERLFQAKFLVHGFTDLLTSPWPTDAVSDYVCDKPKCFSAEEGQKDYYSECCYGHYENDRLLDFTTGNRANKIGPTNKEVFQGTDISRSTYSMPYVYDNFKWNHCSDDFEGKLTSAFALSASRPNVDGQSVSNKPSPGQK